MKHKNIKFKIKEYKKNKKNESPPFIIILLFYTLTTDPIASAAAKLDPGHTSKFVNDDNANVTCIYLLASPFSFLPLEKQSRLFLHFL